MLLVPLDDDVLHDEELDKELLWNLQLLSEVLQSVLPMRVYHWILFGVKLLLLKRSKCCMNDIA